jgi:hypothetical protein
VSTTTICANPDTINGKETNANGTLSQANERVHNDKQRKYCKASFKMKELKKYYRTKATALPAGSPADTSVFDLLPYWIRSTKRSM